MAAHVNGHSNGLYSYDAFGGNTKKSDSNFLCWCAGADEKLLKENPSERTKYVGLGGVILATFVLASLSAGYAVYTVFNQVGWAIFFGLIWGLIIFNFDRFLVSTMRKYGVSTRRQWIMTLPRIALALLIGMTIARPLELKIFEKEIDVKVLENRHHKIALNDSLLRTENDHALLAATLERSRLLNRKSGIEDTLHRLQQAYVQEADGTGGSQQRGIEKLTLLKQEAYNRFLIQFSPELNRLGTQIAQQDSILNTSQANLENKRRLYEAGLTDKVGFLERNKALSDLADQETSVFWADFFIALLIILIETGPILSKLLMPLGPYDLALAKIELTQMAESENAMRKDKQTQFDKLEGFYKMKKELSDETIEQFSKLQKKNIADEMEKWDRGEASVQSRSSLDELARKIKTQYDYSEDNII